MGVRDFMNSDLEEAIDNTLKVDGCNDDTCPTRKSCLRYMFPAINDQNYRDQDGLCEHFIFNGVPLEEEE